MGLGAGIFLVALGAILTFAVRVEPVWLDLDAVGWVLMLAGATLLLLTLWFWHQRRRRLARSIVEEARIVHDQGSAPSLPPDGGFTPPP